jgi:hypothetical protein
MSLSWREAKKWAKQQIAQYSDEELDRMTEQELKAFSWTNQWKYGPIVTGIALSNDEIKILFNQGASEDDKDALNSCIFGLSKWAEKVEAILDDKPKKATRDIFKEMKKYKIKLK